METTIRQLQENELDWLNSKYKEVDFVESSFENEFIIIGFMGNDRAGVARIVKIDDKNVELGGVYVFPEFRGNKIAYHMVEYLCENNPFRKSRIWCLPFEKLESFYSQFGFQKNMEDVPTKIQEKHKWCNENEAYSEQVLLLCK